MSEKISNIPTNRVFMADEKYVAIIFNFSCRDIIFAHTQNLLLSRFFNDVTKEMFLFPVNQLFFYKKNQ